MARYVMVSLVLLCKSEIAQVKSSIFNRYQVLVSMDFIAIALFFLVLLIAFSIVWGTLKTGISPMMSSSKARQAMLAEINMDEKGALIDLGSGWGTLVIAVAKKHPKNQIIGYELSWFPWMISILFNSVWADGQTVVRVAVMPHELHDEADAANNQNLW